MRHIISSDQAPELKKMFCELYRLESAREQAFMAVKIIDFISSYCEKEILATIPVAEEIIEGVPV